MPEKRKRGRPKGSVNKSKPVNFEDFNDVLGTPQVAKLLRCDPATVRRMVINKEIPGRLVGGDWKFHKAAIIAWLQGEVNPQSPP
jgi:excisionase family DNA binding protein